MNAPLPESIRRALDQVTLDDKYRLEQGRAFMSGVQALVKLPMLQRARDAQAGKNTAGFISGYRGSPLGGYDQALWKAAPHLRSQNIVFQPGVNEELAATALWGTQQLGYAPEGSNKYDGVFGIWYGKGPGVDRCSDVFKHANMAGTTPWGGVIAIAGDDHISKSSTAAHQSDHIFKACGSPVFFPSTVQEILDLGLHAFAMSRYAGIWSAVKTIQEIVESSATVEIDPDRVKILLPDDFDMPPGGLHIRWPDAPLEQEARLMHYKWYAALAYVRANRLNRNVIEGPHDRLGLIASGKAYNDTRQALFDLGLDDDTCRRIGLRLHKVAVVWPLEASITREFATGLQEILVIEEKRQVIEYQIKEELYNWRADVRPNVLGKFNELQGDFSGGEWSMPNPTANTLLRGNADLSPALIAQAVAARLRKLGVDADIAARLDTRLALIEAQERALETLEVQGERPPWFCSGCPHNTSTKVPEGSRALGGIGCHYMATWMDRATLGFTQMGGEGVPWVGQQAFSNEHHVFANLGDGTYFHSGLLAIRQAIAAGVNITYKVLYNDAVAMTGGQQVGERPEGHSVLQIMNSLISEGVRKLVIVSDDPAKYASAPLAAGVTVHHRDELDRLQRAFRDIAGTTIIIYDQTCATEKRRRRKRGELADPAKHVVINPLVCEGCGDCSVQSNCLSVEPLETEFGRKRTINQSTCNKDYSCVNGFCPSFVSVEGGKPRKLTSQRKASPDQGPEFPEPMIPDLDLQKSWGIVVAGVGGTGVITIGQILGMAAHLEGRGIVTQDAAGLAQKGGATWSHILLGATQDDIRTTRVGMAGAALVIGCDPIVAAHPETLMRVREGRTFVALNGHSAPTAAFVKDPAWRNPGAACSQEIDQVAGQGQVGHLDADAIASKLMGDSIYANPIMLGYAWQRAWIPLSLATLIRAIELNGVAVEANKTAFAWGRRAAIDLSGVYKLCEPTQIIPLQAVRQRLAGSQGSLDDVVARRYEFLRGYQNEAYAHRYRTFVQHVHRMETQAAAGSSQLALAVAHTLFKLMAYKDEYEVARLHSDPAFLARIAEQFEGDYTLAFHLAPPLLSRRDDQGRLVKRRFGRAVLPLFRLLARSRGLRGTPFDPFGWQAERREERALVEEYRRNIEGLLPRLAAGNLAAAAELARAPDAIRGYGHVKQRNLAAFRERWDRLTADFDRPITPKKAA